MFNLVEAPMANNSNHVQQGKEVNFVYKTYNLSIFRQIEGNRIPNLQHIRRLSESIRVYGMMCNPILVNEKMEVIDGQHRLLAAKEAESFIYYIIMHGYSLNEVHTLNLNQKNWTKKDFMEGYANMGIDSYIKLRDFVNKNNDYSFSDCIAFCSNTSAGSNSSITQAMRQDKKYNQSEIFESGTWKGKDFLKAQDWAHKIRLLKSYFADYNHSVFVGTMITLFYNQNFDFNEFLHKVCIQPSKLVICANRDQMKIVIEDIYNYKSRNKVNLRF